MIWEGRRVKRESRVYNTLTQEKEVFVPREPGKVSVYVCGVTPYADTHLGHARPSVVWDVIIRFLILPILYATLTPKSTAPAAKDSVKLL